MKGLKHLKRSKYFGLSVIIVALALGIKLGFAYADGTYIVSGAVSFNGSPVSGNQATNDVGVSFGDGSGNGGGATVDGSGNYSVGSLPNGSYYDTIAGIGNNTVNSATTGEPNTFDLTATTPYVVVNGSNLTQNISFNTNTVGVTVLDANGNPVPGMSVKVTQAGNGTVTSTDGATFNTSYYSNPIQSIGTTDSNGVATVSVFPGLTYSVCAYATSGFTYCAPANLPVNSNSTITINLPPIYIVSGAVSFNGSPVSGNQATNDVGVSFGDGSGNGGGATVDGSGNYSVGGVENGSYYSFVTGIGNNTVNSGTTGEPNTFELYSSNPYVVVNGSNVTKNLSFNTDTVGVTVLDANGNPLPGANVQVTQVGGNGTVTSADGTTFTATSNTTQSIGTTDSNGAVTVSVFPGLTYSVCAFTGSGNQYCTPTQLTVNSDTTATIYSTSPTDLSSASPTQYPSLTWSSVGGTSQYNIYRNGVEIGSSATTSFTDNSAPVGNDSYYVTAVNSNGAESSPSNTINVVVVSPPSSPTSATATAGSSQASVSFNPPSSNGNSAITSYAVTATDTTNTANGGQTVNGSGSPLTVTGLTVGDSYYFTATATNAIGTSSPSAPSNTVTVGRSPAITSASSVSTGVNVPFSFQITTTGSPTSAITENGTLPSGVTFTDNGNGTATISGTAAIGTNGSYPVTITANNGIGSQATQSFVLTITTATSAPTITSASSATGTTSSLFSFTVTTNGYPVPTLTKTGGLPSGVTFTDNGNGTATIAGTPSATSGGLYTLTLKAKNTAGTVTQTYTLTINQVPTINNITTKTATAGTAFSMTVTAKGYPMPALTESGVLPNGLTFTDNGDGTATITGTPAAGSSGSYSITITATSSQGTASQTFTLNVDQAPAITSAASANATIGSSFTFQVTATGFPAPTISKTGTLPTGITFHASTGTFSGTPAAGTAGSYPITITAKNSSGTVTQNFVLVVN